MSPSVFVTVRTAFDNFWGQFLAEVPQVANPNLRAGVSITFRLVGVNASGAAALLPPGCAVVAQLFPVTASPGGPLVEGALISTLNLTTDSNGQVVAAFTPILDVSHSYEIDLVITDLTGRQQTYRPSLVLQAVAGSDWNDVASQVWEIGTSLSGSTAEAPVTISLGVQITGPTNSGTGGKTVAIWLGVSGGTSAQLTTATLNSSGQAKITGLSVTIGPSSAYVVSLVSGGTTYTSPTTIAGSSIVAYGGIGIQWNGTQMVASANPVS